MDGNDVTGFAEAARATAFAMVEEKSRKEICSLMMAGHEDPFNASRVRAPELTSLSSSKGEHEVVLLAFERAVATVVPVIPAQCPRVSAAKSSTLEPPPHSRTNCHNRSFNEFADRDTLSRRRDYTDDAN